jgi:hypothetical protein
VKPQLLSAADPANGARGRSSLNAHETPDDKPSVAPTLQRSWRFYAGMTALALSCIVPLSAFLVPLLGLSTAQSALLAGVLVAGVPEVLCILAVALLGKDAFQFVAHRAKSVLRRLLLGPVSKARYYAALTVVMVSWLPAYLYAYLPGTMPGDNVRITILAGADLAFVASVVLMGGEFWEKVRRIFVYEGRG